VREAECDRRDRARCVRGVQAVERHKSLLDRKLTAPSMDRFDAHALVSQGRIGFCDAIVKGILAADAPDPDFAEKIVPVPRPTRAMGELQGLLWGHLVVVVVEGEGAEAAEESAVHLTSDQDTVLEYFEMLALTPPPMMPSSPRRSSKTTTSVLGPGQITSPARPGSLLAFPEYAQMETILGDQPQAAVVGNASPADAMQLPREEIGDLIG
jgi:multiple sugar transport system substrate-binding protein